MYYFFLVANCMDVNIAIERFYKLHNVFDVLQICCMSVDASQMSDN